jgi:hypothetical protein
MRRLIAALVILLALPGIAGAHALNEYLQATILSVDKNRVQASMRLVPGSAVLPAVLAQIDLNKNGVVSKAEELAYAKRVLGDLKLSLDGHPLAPRLVKVRFPPLELMKEGLGEIRVDFTADVPPGSGVRKLAFENHHQSHISAYLVNSLVPKDPGVHLAAQHRNADQSVYQLDYTQGIEAPTPPPATSLTTDLGGFSSMFRLGMRHIAGGTDHLLFLLALLLPAPLVARTSRWAGCGRIRESTLQIVRVVTAFTIGHSISLAAAAFGLVSVPGRPIEVLIAVSILVSAAHALRPLFPGREAVIAAFFGLIHGLAFAAALGQLELGWWERTTGVLGFNLGIETMQLGVIAATMPSLLLLSRTRAYQALRVGGALFAAAASLGWIAERLLGLHLFVDVAVDAIAHRAVLLAALLFMAAVACWWQRNSAIRFSIQQ